MDLPDTGIKPGSPELQADSLPTELSGKPSSQKGRKSYFKFILFLVNMRLCSIWNYCITCYKIVKHSKANMGDMYVQIRQNYYSLEMRIAVHDRCIMYFPHGESREHA